MHSGFGPGVKTPPRAAPPCPDRAAQGLCRRPRRSLPVAGFSAPASVRALGASERRGDETKEKRASAGAPVAGVRSLRGPLPPGVCDTAKLFCLDVVLSGSGVVATRLVGVALGVERGPAVAVCGGEKQAALAAGCWGSRCHRRGFAPLLF